MILVINATLIAYATARALEGYNRGVQWALDQREREKARVRIVTCLRDVAV